MSTQGSLNVYLEGKTSSTHARDTILLQAMHNMVVELFNQTLIQEMCSKHPSLEILNHTTGRMRVLDIELEELGDTSMLLGANTFVVNNPAQILVTPEWNSHSAAFLQTIKRRKVFWAFNQYLENVTSRFPIYRILKENSPHEYSNELIVRAGAKKDDTFVLIRILPFHMVAPRVPIFDLNIKPINSRPLFHPLLSLTELTSHLLSAFSLRLGTLTGRECAWIHPQSLIVYPEVEKWEKESQTQTDTDDSGIVCSFAKVSKEKIEYLKNEEAIILHNWDIWRLGSWPEVVVLGSVAGKRSVCLENSVQIYVQTRSTHHEHLSTSNASHSQPIFQIGYQSQMIFQNGHGGIRFTPWQENVLVDGVLVFPPEVRVDLTPITSTEDEKMSVNVYEPKKR